MKKFILGMGLLFLFGYGCGVAPPPEAENITANILDYGIYNEKVLETMKDKSVPGGERARVSYSLVKETDKIPANLGISFGFRYNLYGAHGKGKLKLKRLYFFPEQGLIDTAKRKTYYKAQLDNELTVRENMEIGYRFEHPWELVPGKWSFQIWYEGNKLAEKTFTVYREAGL
jgi:hypothetical protein